MSVLYVSLRVAEGSFDERRKQFVSPPPPSEEEYFKDMKTARDGFEVNAEYIGKRLFSRPAIEELPKSPAIDRWTRHAV